MTTMAGCHLLPPGGPLPPLISLFNKIISVRATSNGSSDTEKDWVFTNGTSQDGISYNTSSYKPGHLEVKFADNTVKIYVYDD